MRRFRRLTASGQRPVCEAVGEADVANDLRAARGPAVLVFVDWCRVVN